MSDYIMEKLGQAELSPALQHVVNKVKSAGLHKDAANMRGMEEFTLRDAVLELSTKLAYNYLKSQKIASGMRALQALEASGDVKLAAGFAEMAARGAKKKNPLLDPKTYNESPVKLTPKPKDPLRDPSTFKQANMFRLPTSPGGQMTNVLQEALQAGRGASTAMPSTLGGGGGVMGALPNAPMASQMAKRTTLRGQQLGEMPSMGLKSQLGIPG